MSDSTEVAVQQQPGQEVDRYKDDGSAPLQHSSLPAPRELNSLWKMAGAYSQMPGMSDTYAGNQPAVMAALLTAWQLDLPTTPLIVNEFYAWKDGARTTMYPSTSIIVALAAKNGVEVWFDEDSDTTFARAFCRRRGDDRVHTYKITMEDAVKAGFTKKKDGGVKDNWRAAPDVMLRYRSVRRLLKSVAPDVVLGIPSNVLEGEAIPVLSRAELEAQAVEIAGDEFECETPGCEISEPHKHDPAVANKPSAGYAPDDPERPFTEDAEA